MAERGSHAESLEKLTLERRIVRAGTQLANLPRPFRFHSPVISWRYWHSWHSWHQPPLLDVRQRLCCELPATQLNLPTFYLCVPPWLMVVKPATLLRARLEIFDLRFFCAD